MGTFEITLGELVRLYAKLEGRAETIKRLMAEDTSRKEAAELALLAFGGERWREEFCRCDPEVGMSPCQYCAIHGALTRVAEK